MTSGPPWSVKGIDPKAREAAKDLARRSGMTLGEWLNQVILEDTAAEEAPPLPRPQPIDRRPTAPVYRRVEAPEHPGDEISRVTEALEFFHQIRIGQTVKTIALNAFRIKPPRQWQQLGHARHGLVKCRVKARHLRQFRMAFAKHLNEFNLARQMIRVVRADATQFIQEFFCDHLRLGVFHPMNHPMSHAF